MNRNDGRARQVTYGPNTKNNAEPCERKRQATDSPRGWQLYSHRIGIVEPVFDNIRYNKRLPRLNHRSRTNINMQ